MQSNSSKDFLKNSNQKIIEDRKYKRKKISVIFLAIFIVLVVGSVFFLRVQKFLITNVSVSGNVVIEGSDLQKSTLERLNGKYLWLIPKNNTFLISTRGLQNRLQNMFPRISKIDVKRVGLKGLSISIEEYTSEYIVCGSAVEKLKMDQDSQCLFMDKDGTIFGYAPYISGSVYTVFYDDKSFVPGQRIYDKETFAKLTTFDTALKKFDFNVASIVHSDDADFYFYIKQKDSSLTEIRVNIKDDIEKTINRLSSVIASDSFKDNQNLVNISYIDLRFGNKVFYKNK